MSAGLIALAVICSLIILALLGYWVYTIYRDDEIKEEPTYVINLMPQYTNGHAIGILKNITYGVRRNVVTFLPIDVNYRRPEKVEFQHVAVENSKRRVFGKGTLSKQSNVMWLIPPTTEELPDTVKNVPEGVMLMKIMEDDNGMKEESEVLRNRTEAQSKIKMKTEGMGLVEQYIELEDLLRKDSMKKFINQDKKTDTVFGNNPGGP